MQKSAKGKAGRKAARGQLWLHLPGMVREALYETVSTPEQKYITASE
jgi:hypothetical protein